MSAEGFQVHSMAAARKARSQPRPLFGEMEVVKPDPAEYRAALRLAGGDPRRVLRRRTWWGRVEVIVLNSAGESLPRRDDRIDSIALTIWKLLGCDPAKADALAEYVWEQVRHDAK